MTLGLQQANKHLSMERLLSLLSYFLLLIAGSRRFSRVSGDSMEPTLHEGDIVIYHPILRRKQALQDGMIVIVKSPIEKDTLIIKRIQNNTPKGIDIRGDNKGSSIDSRQFGLVNQKNILGIVEHIIYK